MRASSTNPCFSISAYNPGKRLMSLLLIPVAHFNSMIGNTLFSLQILKKRSTVHNTAVYCTPSRVWVRGRYLISAKLLLAILTLCPTRLRSSSCQQTYSPSFVVFTSISSPVQPQCSIPFINALPQCSLRREDYLGDLQNEVSKHMLERLCKRGTKEEQLFSW